MFFMVKQKLARVATGVRPYGNELLCLKGNGLAKKYTGKRVGFTRALN